MTFANINGLFMLFSMLLFSNIFLIEKNSISFTVTLSPGNYPPLACPPHYQGDSLIAFGYYICMCVCIYKIYTYTLYVPVLYIYIYYSCIHAYTYMLRQKQLWLCHYVLCSYLEAHPYLSAAEHPWDTLQKKALASQRLRDLLAPF